MADLLLHIGHMKTGSTYLQSVLSSSRDALGSHGIHYPLHGDDARHVDHDAMTPVGNARGLLRDEAAFGKALAAHRRSTQDLLYSSETLFDAIAEAADIGFLARRAAAVGFSRIRVLLFTRNPIGHGVSFWQQRVKGWQGETLPLDQWLAERYDTPVDVLRTIDRLEAIGCDVSVLNYDQCRGSLREELAGWLGVSDEILAVPPRERPNRSMSAGEVLLQLAMNEQLGASGRVFAFRLVNRLPDLDGDPLVPSPAAQLATWQRLQPAIEDVNALVPIAHRYSFDEMAPNPHEDGYRFNEAQLRIIAEGFGAEVRRLRRTSAEHHLRRLALRLRAKR